MGIFVGVNKNFELAYHSIIDQNYFHDNFLCYEYYNHITSRHPNFIDDFFKPIIKNYEKDLKNVIISKRH